MVGSDRSQEFLQKGDFLAFPGQGSAGRLWGVLQAGGPGYGVAGSCHGCAQGECVPSVPHWWRAAITATCSSCLTLEVEFRQPLYSQRNNSLWIISLRRLHDPCQRARRQEGIVVLIAILLLCKVISSLTSRVITGSCRHLGSNRSQDVCKEPRWVAARDGDSTREHKAVLKKLLSCSATCS